MTKIKSKRTWKISDIDGSNERTVTLTQYRAELDAAKATARANYRRTVEQVAQSRKAPIPRT